MRCSKLLGLLQSIVWQNTHRSTSQCKPGSWSLPSTHLSSHTLLIQNVCPPPTVPQSVNTPVLPETHTLRPLKPLFGQAALPEALRSRAQHPQSGSTLQLRGTQSPTAGTRAPCRHQACTWCTDIRVYKIESSKVSH